MVPHSHVSRKECHVYFGKALVQPQHLLIIILMIFASSHAAVAQSCKEVSQPDLDGLLVITQYSNGVGKSGFIDRTGKIIVPPKYDEAYSFSGGLGLVRLGDLYGFVDRNGTELIKPKFGNACSFSEGLAAVRINSKYGYIDKSGEPKIPPQFEGADNFSEGLARIKIIDAGEEQFSYIDRSGKTITDATFDSGSSFRGGVARVFDSVFHLETYIDSRGKILSRRSNISVEGIGFASSLVEIKFESKPAGATIYMIPKRRIEKDPALPNKAEDQLLEFLVPSGSAPTTFKAKQKVFTVLLILNGVRKPVQLDVRPDGSNQVRVDFP
jgi:hypothetical protein